jgi:hypothetical protein
MRTAAVSLAIGLCAMAEEPPPATGVTVELRAERTEFAVGDPILVEIVYRNDGKETCEIWEPHVLRFYRCFEVRDATGAEVPNPYAEVDSPCYDGRVTMHKLPPGGTVTLRNYVNECAAFDKPGEYVVTASGGVSMLHGLSRGSGCPSRPLKVKILPAPEKKVRDKVVADLKALWQNPKLLSREEYAPYRPYITEMNGSTDALRLLAFRREQDLLPFWIERLGDRRSAFAAEALAGLPDRAAVLKALEERLGRGVDGNVLAVYVLLAAPGTDKDAFARRKEIRERYEGK